MFQKFLVLNGLSLAELERVIHPYPFTVYLWKKTGHFDWHGIFSDGIDFTPSFLLSVQVGEIEISFQRLNRRSREEESFIFSLQPNGLWEGKSQEKISSRTCRALGHLTTNPPLEFCLLAYRSASH